MASRKKHIMGLSPYRFRMGIIGLALLLVFLSITLPSAKAQELKNNFVLVENSLSRILGLRTVRAALLDQSGQLWIGTQSGLFLFNGSDLSGNLSSRNRYGRVWKSDIASIKEGANGTIWVLTANDGLYSVTKNDIVRGLEPEQYASSLSDAHTLEVTNSHVWVGDITGLQTIRLVFGLPESSYSLNLLHGTTESLTNISKTQNGEICVGSGHELLCWTEHANFKGQHSIFPSTSSTESRGVLTAISSTSKDGAIVAGTSRGDVLLFSLPEDKAQTLCQLKLSATATVTSIKHIDVGAMVGTDNGLFQISIDNNQCSAVLINQLNNAHVTDFYTFGSHVWVSTYTGLYTVKSSPFFHFSRENSPIDNEIMSFEAAGETGLFIGSYNGLFLQQELAGGITEVPLPATNNGPANKRVMALEYDGIRLWVGLRDGGILWYDLAQGEFLDPPIVLDQLSITTVKRSPNGDVLIGTYGDGLWIFSETNKGQANVYKVSSSNGFQNITAIESIDDHTIFVAAEFNGGIFCRNDSIWSMCETAEDTFFSSNFRILSIAYDRSQNVLWFGTQNDGLHRLNFDLDLGWNTQKTDLDVHNNESIFSIIKIDSGALWLGTSNGLIELSPTGGKNQVYFAQDGLQDNDFNYGAALLSPAGHLYFGGSNGFNVFNPSHLELDRAIPQLYFRKIQLGGAQSSHLQQYDGTSRIELHHSDYFFKIFFHLSDFINAQNVSYRYKLHPFDPSWINGGNDGSATYTNIPPGDYVFQVQGANSAGVWNNEGIAMNLRVLPPPWRTWWAYCLYAIGVYILLFMGKKWYDSNVLRVKATEIAREKTLAADAALDDMHEQLEAQDMLVRNVRRRNIATLDTVADIIQHRVDYLHDDVSADIMRGSGTHVHALALLEQSLKYYNDSLFADLNAFTADVLSELSKEHASSHHVTTINEVTDELIPAYDATMLAVIIHELVSNAFSHAFNERAGSKYLRVVMVCSRDTHTDSKHIELTVQDNGSGIPEGVSADLPGLSLVQKIVRQYGGTMEATSRNGSSIAIALTIRQPTAP